MDLDYFFDNCQQYAFRLETLPYYSSDTSKAGYAEFQATGTLPTDHNSRWRQEVTEALKRGVAYRRLRLFSERLSVYERYEQAAYEQSRSAGEDIRAIVRSQGEMPPDFWYFDDRWIAIMKYNETGDFMGSECREATQTDKALAERWMSIFSHDASDPGRFS